MIASAGRRRRDAAIRESFDGIRERILAAGAASHGPGAIVVLVTASSRGQGVTSVTIGLADALGRRPACRTLVVDHDASAQGIALRLGAPPKVVDVPRDAVTASEVRAWVQRLEEHGFDLITLSPDYAPGVEAAVRDTVLKDLRSLYDLVVIDAGSLEMHTALAWGRQADQTLLVVDTTVMTVAALERVKSDLAYGGHKVTGVILNKREFPVPDLVYRWLR